MRLLSSGWAGAPRPFPRRFVTFMIVLVALLAIFPLYSHLKRAAAPIPPGVYVGGLALSDMKDTEQIRAHLLGAYSGPIGVNFGDKKLALRPEDVNFQLDLDHMLAEAQQYVDGPVHILLRLSCGRPAAPPRCAHSLHNRCGQAARVA